jgi:Mg2+ and Co2+ transporter CorA
MRRILAPKRFYLLIEKLNRKIASYIVSKDFNLISKDIQAYFRDILDHLTSALEKIEYSRDSLSQTVFSIFLTKHSNYLAKISIEISESSSGTDKFMNLLSLFAIALIPFGVVSGLFGMNVQVRQ